MFEGSPTVTDYVVVTAANAKRAERTLKGPRKPCSSLQFYGIAPFPKVIFEKNPTGHLLPICSHTTPKHAETRPNIRDHRASPNWRTSRLSFVRSPARSERCRLWPSRAHNPKVAGSNPAPATMKNEGLADVEAANPFVYPTSPRNRCYDAGRLIRFSTHRSLIRRIHRGTSPTQGCAR